MRWYGLLDGPDGDRRLLCRGLVPPRSRTRDVRSSRGWLQCWGTGKEGPRADLQSVLAGAGEDLGVSGCCRTWAPGNWQGGGNVLRAINRTMAVSWEDASAACRGRGSLSPRSIWFPVVVRRKYSGREQAADMPRGRRPDRIVLYVSRLSFRRAHHSGAWTDEVGFYNVVSRASGASTYSSSSDGRDRLALACFVI